jgi:hypothetical protein
VEDTNAFTLLQEEKDLTSPDITAHYWSKKSLESALDNAGLTEIRWIVPTPSPDAIEKHGADFWTDVIRSPFELIVTCRKS